LDKLKPSSNRLIIIGVGHRAHRTLLQQKKLLSNSNKITLIAVLRPTFNAKKFDVIVAPEHDYHNRKMPTNSLLFKGSLCKTSLVKPENNKLVVCIGGPIKNVPFEKRILIDNLKYIIDTHQQFKISIFNSRRTPDDVWSEISSYENIKLHDSKDTDFNFFNANLVLASKKFITPDSISMIFESLSSYGETYLLQTSKFSKKSWFSIKSNKHQRINNELLDEKRIGIVQKRDVFDKSGVISHMISPNPGFEPLAEVEKIAFQIKRLINE
jgi:mitochondrial fission protein ELM1